MGSIIFNYNIANYLKEERPNFLIFGIIINILVLCIFKYTIL